jgi:hypothetical protein
MKQPLESKRSEPSVGAANVPQSITGEDKTAARKAAKVDWNAGAAFPIASDPGLWGAVVSAASRARSTLDAALTLAQAGVPVFPVSPVGQKKPLKWGVQRNDRSGGGGSRLRQALERAHRRAHGPPDWRVRDGC